MGSRVAVEHVLDDDEVIDDGPLLDDSDDGTPVVPTEPKGWFRQRFHNPVMMLIFLSFVSLLNYYDRGAFVGSMTLIKEEYDLTDDEAGLFGSAFIIGYAVASPIMAQLSRYMRSGLLLAIGMVSWCLATGLCFFARGLPHGFEFLMVMRCLTGIGEAAFICLSPALIDDVAPPTQRSRWLAIFFSMLPIGYAAGYMGAGLIGHYMGWQYVFLIEALVALPFALLCYFLPNIRRQGDDDPLSGPAPVKPFHRTLFDLLRNPIFVLMTLGYCAQTFVLGALTFWLPHYVYVKYELPVAKADFLIGAVTATCGILGNLFSAFIMDFIVSRRRVDPTRTGIAMSVLFVACALPMPFGAVFMDGLVGFLILMMLAEFLILCTVTPVNAVFLSCVPDDMRSHSMAIMTLLIHILGDMWSPYIYGLLSESFGAQRPEDPSYGLECALLFTAAWGIWTFIFWCIAWWFIRRGAVRGSIKLSP